MKNVVVLLLVAVDVSYSTFFSSIRLACARCIAQIASVLALVAEYGKDQIGLLLFSDTIEYYIPPAAGKFHVRKIMETIIEFEPKSKKTNIAIALEHMAKLKRKDAILFVLSDFIDIGFDRQLALTSTMYDLIAVRYLDKNAKTLPAVGFLTVEDIETGEINTIDVSKKGSSPVNHFLHTRLTEQNDLFKKYGVSVIDIEHDRHFIGELSFFPSNV